VLAKKTLVQGHASYPPSDLPFLYQTVQIRTYSTCDENPKTVQIQGPMTRSRTKQSVDTLQQMVAGILSKAQVEKDKSPSGEGQKPKWRRTKAEVEKDEAPSGEG